jgi:hypothetical protein
MAEDGTLLLQGNVLKELKDFEVKLPGGDAQQAPVAEENVATS